tara:strand:+ start:38981 stop:39436 length:456 start_codon:yes stop_codon:yes gene_type:complete
MLQFLLKNFDELSTTELYTILQLRSEVFVVEQDCVYQDLDGKDFLALHLMGISDGNIVAYTRIFKDGDYFPDAGSIGRVLVKASERKYGYGVEMVRESLTILDKNLKVSKTHISAQRYLEKFYASLGFEVVGEPYLEDGIPHIGMVRLGQS